MTLALCFVLALTMAPSLGFYNPIVNPGQDPSVKYYNGNYYLVQSYGSIVVMRSQHLEDLGQPEQTVTVWSPTAPGGQELCCDIWAPELVLNATENRWYIYFAADKGDNDSHRSYVLQAVGSDPMGPYTLLGKVSTDTGDHWSIDSTVMELNGKSYFVWSGLPDNMQDSHQSLYIAEMSGPAMLSSDRSLISAPTNDWEIASDGVAINEGPAVLQHGDRTFIAYSASAAYEDSYCLGLLTYAGGDPLSPDSWQKSNGPVFQQDPGNSAYGPGHNSFTTSPDGSETWNVYHAIVQSGAGFDGRSIRAQKINWNGDTPDFGVPASFDDWIDPPAGE